MTTERLHDEDLAALHAEMSRSAEIGSTRVSVLNYQISRMIQEIRDRRKMAYDYERLQVQLAGCSTAAMGGTSLAQIAEPGTYGWSVAYQDVLTLRRAFECLTKLAPSQVLDQHRPIKNGSVWRELDGKEFRVEDAGVMNVTITPIGRFAYESITVHYLRNNMSWVSDPPAEETPHADTKDH